MQLELSWEDQLYDFHKNNRPVHTASFKQVRSKIFKNSSEQWKKYETYLKPMSDILKKIILFLDSLLLFLYSVIYNKKLIWA